MNDPLISRFAQDCGATAPLNLRVESNGSMLAEGTVHQPFTLIGRDDACDVTLTDPDVNLRHAWLQVLGGRPFLIDLGSRTGLSWPTGTRPYGWLDVGTPVAIGPFHFSLRSAPSLQPAAALPAFNPLRADPDAAWARPTVGLEFRNGRRPRDRWPVNRMVTLIGRSPDCKIHLNADDIAMYHCGLVLTPNSLWVVDLSGRGVVVDGERMRVAPLRHSSELWVGRFLIACVFPNAGATPAVPSLLQAMPAASPLPLVRNANFEDQRPDRTGGLMGPTPGAFATPAPIPSPLTGSPSGLFSATTLLAGVDLASGRDPRLADLIPEDEVPLGVQPLMDSGSLPSSHIMADAFDSLKKALADRNAPGAVAGPNSGSISLSGTMTPPPINPHAGPRTPSRSTPRAQPVPGSTPSRAALPPAPPALPADVTNEPEDAPVSVIIPLLKQLGEVHGQMFEQFQQSMLLVAHMFGQMHRDQMTHMQQELLRIQELNAELAKLQNEVAHRAMVHALGQSSAAGLNATVGMDSLSSETPPLIPSPLPREPDRGETQAAMQTYVTQRITALQQERQRRWAKLVSCLTTCPEGASA